MKRGPPKNTHCSKCGKNIEDLNCSYNHGKCMECAYHRHDKWKKNNPEKLKESVRNGVKKHYKKQCIGYPEMIKQIKINGCAICGYNKCISALDFHHINPEDKCFELNKTNIILSRAERTAEELQKCMLLCANCHREIEALTRLTC